MADEQEQKYVDIVNELLDHARIPARIRRLEECTPLLFVAVFELMFETQLERVVRNPLNERDAEANYDAVVQGLAAVLQMPLAHITGAALVAGSRPALCNLIEILCEMWDILAEAKRADALDAAEQSSPAAARSVSPDSLGGAAGGSASPPEHGGRGQSGHHELGDAGNQSRHARFDLSRNEEIMLSRHETADEAELLNELRALPTASLAHMIQRAATPATILARAAPARPMSAGGPVHPSLRAPLAATERTAAHAAGDAALDDYEQAQLDSQHQHLMAEFERFLDRRRDARLRGELESGAELAADDEALWETQAAAAEGIYSAIDERARVGLDGADAAALRGPADVRLDEDVLVALGVPSRLAAEWMAKQRAQWARQSRRGPARRDTLFEEMVRRQEAQRALLDRERKADAAQSQRAQAVALRAAASKAKLDGKLRRVRVERDNEDELRALRARHLQRRDREEVALRRLFEQCLRLQREQLRDAQRAAKDEARARARAVHARKTNLERQYAEKLAMAREQGAVHKRNADTAARAQSIALDSLERDMRKSLRAQVAQLRYDIACDDARAAEEFPDEVAARLVRLDAAAAQAVRPGSARPASRPR